VIKYAPSCHQFLYERLTEIIAEFDELHLARLYPDRDSEVFVPYGLLPHYILGYSHLKRRERRGSIDIYAVEYIANPKFASGAASLDRPPDLDAEQCELIESLGHDIAWGYHTGSDWDRIRHSSGEIDISGTGPLAERHALSAPEHAVSSVLDRLPPEVRP
jgi:hypothetical protein